MEARFLLKIVDTNEIFLLEELRVMQSFIEKKTWNTWKAVLEYALNQRAHQNAYKDIFKPRCQQYWVFKTLERTYPAFYERTE